MIASQNPTLEQLATSFQLGANGEILKDSAGGENKSVSIAKTTKNLLRNW